MQAYSWRLAPVVRRPEPDTSLPGASRLQRLKQEKAATLRELPLDREALRLLDALIAKEMSHGR